jgi:hypothetical protein
MLRLSLEHEIGQLREQQQGDDEQQASSEERQFGSISPADVSLQLPAPSFIFSVSGLQHASQRTPRHISRRSVTGRR